MEIIGMEPQKLYFNFHHFMLRDSLNERTDMSEATSMSVRMCRGLHPVRRKNFLVN